MRLSLAVLLLAVSATTANAEILSRTVEYKDAATKLEGVFAFDTVMPGKRPSVLVAHAGAGNGPAAKELALRYAKHGYPTLAIDLFGSGITPKDRSDAIARLSLIGGERGLVRSRTEAALAFLAKQPQCDPTRVAGVGFGVGGTALLELARTGADLEGVACVHGDLGTPNPADGKKISASVLVLLGTDDPHVPLKQLLAFEDEMKAGGVDWQVLRFGGVGHDFTNQAAGRNLKSGTAYDADADARSQIAIKNFLIESFPAKSFAPAKPTTQPKAVAPPKGIPAKALSVLQFVDANGRAMDNYEGGRTFGNYERRLPGTDPQGRRLRYREWDVNLLRPGVNRGAERMITGSDGSAYYTDDHYATFKKIR